MSGTVKLAGFRYQPIPKATASRDACPPIVYSLSQSCGLLPPLMDDVFKSGLIAPGPESNGYMST
jgi:hypothetical protein